jgi:hypothetical protein
MDVNGKFVAAEEAKALGGGEVFVMRQLVAAWGIETRMESRAVDVERKGNSVEAVILDNGERIEADIFVDCSGSWGGVDVCTQYGNGCAMCIFRCVSFGNRVSIATKAGAPELMRRRPDGTPGAASAAILLYKASLAPALRERLEKEGAVTIPLPEELVDYSKQQKIGGVRSRRQMENLNVVDVGISAKCVGSGPMLLADLRRVPGLEAALVEHPIGGGKCYHVSKVSMTPREPWLQVKGFENLFVAGEKAGPLTGIAEVITTGILAGHNAVRKAAGRAPVILPATTAIGDFVEFTGEMMKTEDGLSKSYSYAHDVYFERMKELGFYTTDADAIHRRIANLGLSSILAEKVAS